MAEPANKEKLHFKARDLNLIMIMISFIASLILIIFSSLSAARLKHLKASLTKASVFRSSSLKIRETSNYLTDQARLFVVTGDLQYLNNYFLEKNETKKRNAVLKELGEVFAYDEIEFKKLQTTFAQSESLSEIEMYAMKLMVLSGNYSEDEIPDEIKSKKIKEKDSNLSKKELKDMSLYILFSSSYLIYKSRIDENCSFLINSIESSNEKEVTVNFEKLRERFLWQSLTQLLIFIVLVIFFILNIILIISPINSYMKSISSDIKLTETGSFELRCLAKTYNKFFELKAANERRLKKHAETDPLTGLYNRRAFDDICRDFANIQQNVVYLIIDVDNFKTVNDTYGHPAGDKVLKIISRELMDTFRTTDFIARIGGDEFAILLTEFNGNAEYTVRNKIKALNDRLNELKEYGRISISVGAVHSEKGFSQELVAKADKALYQVKASSKCGFKLYSENI